MSSWQLCQNIVLCKVDRVLKKERGMNNEKCLQLKTAEMNTASSNNKNQTQECIQPDHISGHLNRVLSLL